MNHRPADRTVFITWVSSVGERGCARLLIDSIRTFGGALSNSPIWVFEARPDRAPCASLAQPGVEVLPLEAPVSVRHYLFAGKVWACARAEGLATSEIQSIVFLAPKVLITRPPLLFDLASVCDAAVRPVHIRNVGLAATAPLDDFWQKVYQTVGVGDVAVTVESFVDAQHIRAYFTSAAWAVNPHAGLCRRWFECFAALVNDRAFQSGPCQDQRHQIFLHQAILSALIATAFAPERVRTLPPDYGYPYNLHLSVLPGRQAATLNELTCVIYEERSIDPAVVDDVGIEEPLRSWLAARADWIHADA